MYHIPILGATGKDSVLEFSHFNTDASAGLWKKENVIVRDSFKINVFIEGSFSIFADGVLHRPAYGDICLLPPMKMHYGQITEATHINYYQLDVGTKAFSSIPGGGRIIERLFEALENNDSFLRPDAKSGDSVLKLCQEIEAAIENDEFFLAYARVVELLAELPLLYSLPTKVLGVAYSLRTAGILRYIETHYQESVSVKQISEKLGVSTSFLSRIFKKEIGASIHEYLNQYRISKSISLLKTNSVTEVGYMCGFCDNSHFISVFKKYVGVTPLQYKRQQYREGGA